MLESYKWRGRHATDTSRCRCQPVHRNTNEIKWWAEFKMFCCCFYNCRISLKERSETGFLRKYVAVHEITLLLLHRKILPAFYAIIGYDNISQLSGHIKTTAWTVLQENAWLPEKLAKECISNQTVKNAKMFVCKLYSPATEKIHARNYTVCYFCKVNM